MGERVPLITERDFAAAWNDGCFRGPFALPDGRVIDIVHRGTWTHGFGPDFRDCVVSIDGRSLLSGSIELHLKTSGWRAHGHHLDPRYNDVILHVVLDDDGAETRRLDGKIVLTITLPPELSGRIAPRSGVDWSLVGGEVCAAGLAHEQPARVRQAIWTQAEMRLAAKVARLESRLTDELPADVLYQEIWDGLGFSANRDPMTVLAHRLPLSAIEAVLAIAGPRERLAAARGMLFGVAGLLPISPSDANFARWSPDETSAAEAAWARYGGPWRELQLPATAWTRARVRPANHPALRLSAGASLLAAVTGGLLPTLLTAVRDGSNVPQLLRALCSHAGHSPLGVDRATAIVTNGILPFALALSEHSGDVALGESAAHLWETLPAAGSNEVTRRALRQVAGDIRLPGLGERGMQGLIHLDQTLCRPRRCFECPIASAVVHHKQ